MNRLRYWKTRLGYYDARWRLRRRPFQRALRPADTFLLGHPKSGNTWLAYMLAILLFRDRDGRITLANVGDYVPFVHGHDHRIRQYRRLPDPRVFRNENPQYSDLYPRTIYLVRDPRAALVSLWHMYQTMFDEPDFGLVSFLDQYLTSGGIFEWWNSKLIRWDRQVGDALERAESDQAFCMVRYEDLVADRAACLHRLADFLEIVPSDEELGIAVSRGGFEEMRRLEDEHGSEAYSGRAKGEGRFIRVGRIDSWREELAPELVERITDELGSVMQRAGYL